MNFEVGDLVCMNSTFRRPWRGRQLGSITEALLGKEGDQNIYCVEWAYGPEHPREMREEELLLVARAGFWDTRKSLLVDPLHDVVLRLRRALGHPPLQESLMFELVAAVGAVESLRREVDMLRNEAERTAFGRRFLERRSEEQDKIIVSTARAIEDALGRPAGVCDVRELVRDAVEKLHANEETIAAANEEIAALRAGVRETLAALDHTSSSAVLRNLLRDLLNGEESRGPTARRPRCQRASEKRRTRRQSRLRSASWTCSWTTPTATRTCGPTWRRWGSTWRPPGLASPLSWTGSKARRPPGQATHLRTENSRREIPNDPHHPPPGR